MELREFEEGMSRILAFYQTPKDAAGMKAYMGELFQALIWMPGAYFNRVVAELIKSLHRGQRPMPAQFSAVYHRLRLEEPKEPERKCLTCDGNHMVTWGFKSFEDGRIEPFAIPCAVCCPKHPLLNAPIRDGWEKLGLWKDTGGSVEAMASRLGHVGARYVLAEVEKGRVRYADTLLTTLIHKAGEGEVAPVAPVEEVPEWSE